MRWFYYYPTWNKPSGGNKQIRLTAALLAELGVETFLLRDRSYFAAEPVFDDNVFYNAPVELAPFVFEEAGSHLKPDDVLLIPEVVLEKALSVCRGWNCRIALNNQNGFYALRYRPPLRETGRLEFAIANAPYVAALCKKHLGIPSDRIFIVPHWVVRPPFDIRESDGRRPASVCYMPRKLAEEVRKVREAVLRTHPAVPWVEIDGVPEPEVARRYRENGVFFAAQDLEGCPLPALEAMASGCLVAGFAGTGHFPHPYARADNGLWAPDRDVTAAAEAVRRAVQVVGQGGPRYERYLEAGRQTARRFTKEAVREALTEVVRVVGDRSYGGRKNLVNGLGWGGELFAYRLLYNYDQLGWAGQLLSSVSKTTKPFRRMFSGLRR